MEGRAHHLAIARFHPNQTMRPDRAARTVARMESRDRPTRAPILAAFSPDSVASEPVEFGLAASRFTGAPLIVLAVRHGGPLVSHFGGGGVSDTQGDSDRTIEHMRLSLDRRGIRDVEVKVVEERTAAGGVLKAMQELDPELIVLGSTRRGAAGRVLIGSTATRVIHESPCPVVVVPNGYERPEGGMKVVGAAFAPTEEGREALHAAAVLARIGGARLRAITVLDPDHAEAQSHGLMAEQQRQTDPDEAIAARQRLATEAGLRDAVADLSKSVEADIDVLVNDPADGLVAASKRLDLLVMGSRAHGPKRAALLGSVSRRVAEQAACPVLVIPRGATITTEQALSDAEARAPRS
jgi:nucleotide-binding universal stress UspA family protein